MLPFLMNRVKGVVRVSLRAMGLGSKVLTCATPRYVFLIRHYFKVIRTNACTVSAQMVKHQPGRYRPNQLLIRESMGPNEIGTRSELPVTLPVDISCPEPTTIGLVYDLLPEPGLPGASLSHVAL